MKRRFSLLLVILLSALASKNSVAQKFGYVDSQFILEKMPEYKKAKEEIERKSTEWKEEITKAWSDVDKLKRDFKAEEVLLTDLMRKERLDTIAAREQAAKNMQDKYFGINGLHFLKRQEIVKPLQDKIFEAIETVSNRKQISVMFDKSGALVMLYTDPRHDYTDFVLEELGLGDPADVIDNPKHRHKDR